MKVSDRLVVAIVAALALAAAMWFLVVTPERAKVSDLNAQITAERVSLSTAQAQVAAARSAATGYLGHLQQISEVIRAVPKAPEEAALIATIDKLAGTNVDFRELDLGSAGASTAGPDSVSMTFTYWTTYQRLQAFLASLDKLTLTDGTNVSSNGRLITVNSVELVPLDDPGLAPANTVRATLSAVAYLQSDAAAPSGATGATGATTPPAAAAPPSTSTTPTTG
jgi:Tfp pilus assembly protein PilO